MRKITRWIAVNLVAMLVYVGTGKLSDTLAVVRAQASPIWAPSGLMVAFVLIFGYNIWAGMLLGTLVTNVWYFHHRPVHQYVPAACSYAVFSTLESMACGWLLNHSPKIVNRRVCLKVEEARKGARTVDTLHDALWLFVVAPLVSFVFGTFSAVSLAVFGIADWSELLEIWPTWVLGDWSAILCYTPFLLHLWNVFVPETSPINWARVKCYVLREVAVEVAPGTTGKFRDFLKNEQAEERTGTGTVRRSDFERTSSFRRSNFESDNGRPSSVSDMERRMLTSGKRSELDLRPSSVRRSDFDGYNATEQPERPPKKLLRSQIPFLKSKCSIRKCVLKVAECLALFVVLIVVSLLIFFNIGVPDPSFISRLSYVVFPIVIWASFRFNRIGLPLAVLVVAVIASAGTARCRGPLYHKNKNQSLLQVQMFICVLSLVAITLASIVHDRKQMVAEKNEMNSTLELQVLARTNDLERANRELQESQASAQDASRAKSEFLANMSHEIRTPIHAIINMASLALETDLTLDQREQLETVHESADSLLQIVNTILDLSKIEAGRLELEHDEFNLRSLLSGTIKMLQVTAGKKHLQLSWDIAPDVPEHLVGDAVKLRQCLLNLVGNAIKFTQDGSVILYSKLYEENEFLRATSSSHALEYVKALERRRESQSPAAREDSVNVEHQDKVCVLFAVKDTGIGITKEKQREVFKAFSQADSSITRLYGGTGLGLSIVERLVAMMEGRIWLESESGKGSTFYFAACFDRVQRRVDNRKPLNLDDEETVVKEDDRLIQDRLTSGNRASSSEGHIVIEIEEEVEHHANGFRSSLTSRQPNGQRLERQIKQPPPRGSEAVGQEADEQQGEVGEADIENQLGHQQQQEQENGGEPKDLLAGLRVLLAEDNKVNQKVACQQLKKYGTLVDVVSDGQQCLEALERNRDGYDLILMDVQMPVLDGLQATRSIRAQENEHGYTHIPIIGLTAHAIRGYKDNCLEAGMDDYACKPFRAQQLVDVMQKVLMKSRLAS